MLGLTKDELLTDDVGLDELVDADADEPKSATTELERGVQVARGGVDARCDVGVLGQCARAGDRREVTEPHFEVDRTPDVAGLAKS